MNIYDLERKFGKFAIPNLSLVVQNFRQFFRSNIVPYQHPELPVHFVGSMAFIYRDQLILAAEKEGFHVGHTLQSPMEGLITYHEKGVDAAYR